MSKHARFCYKSLAELRTAVREMGLDLAFDKDLSPLARPVRIGPLEAPISLAVQPMEGCDGSADGRPEELTFRRYERFARGGAGLIWFEATAVTPEARANPRQLWLHAGSQPDFARMLDQTLHAARQVYGADHRPVTVLQLTHSGRYSRPQGKRAPILAHHDGVLDELWRLPPDYPLISDAELDALIDRYVEAARLARNAGFDAVDVKSCHRYLLSELLAAHTRPGRYGGSFENRTRFLLTTVERIRQEVPGLVVGTRLNVYDGHPYPWGWGVSRDDPAVPDLAEPIRLARALRERGALLVNVSAGNPYFTPHVTRSYDTPMRGAGVPDEHPLEGVARLVSLARQVQTAAPEVAVVGSGYTWLRQFLGPAAAASLRRGWATMVGLGRGALAYPDFARALLEDGGLDPRRCCITCSLCTQIMRDGGRTGCATFDREIYGPIYRQGRSDKV